MKNEMRCNERLEKTPWSSEKDRLETEIMTTGLIIESISEARSRMRNINSLKAYTKDQN